MRWIRLVFVAPTTIDFYMNILVSFSGVKPFFSLLALFYCSFANDRPLYYFYTYLEKTQTHEHTYLLTWWLWSSFVCVCSNKKYVSFFLFYFPSFLMHETWNILSPKKNITWLCFTHQDANDDDDDNHFQCSSTVLKRKFKRKNNTRNKNVVLANLKLCRMQMWIKVYQQQR